MPAEQTFYADEDGIRITATRAIFGPITYAMANITSVTRGEEPAKRKPGILVAIVGSLTSIVGSSFNSTMWIIIGVLVLALGIYIAYVAKREYYLKITSAAGESTPISSKDKKYIDGIAVAINEALIRRG